MFLVLVAIYVILENFQKPLGGLFIAVRRHMLINMVLGFLGRNRLVAHSRLPGDA